MKANCEGRVSSKIGPNDLGWIAHMHCWLPSIILRVITLSLNLEQQLTFLVAMVDDLFNLPFRVYEVLGVSERWSSGIAGDYGHSWFQVSNVDDWVYSEHWWQTQLTSIVQDLLYLKRAYPPYIEQLWLSRTGQQPHSLSGNVLGSRGAFHLTMHSCPYLGQTFPSQVEAFLIITGPLSCYLVLDLLRFVANVWSVSACDMKWRLTDCPMETQVIGELECA